MLPERWNEIKDKLHEVLQLGPTRRAVYLAETGSTDPDLQRELESLIAFHEQTGTDFLNTPWAQNASATASQVRPDEFLGKRVGDLPTSIEPFITQTPSTRCMGRVIRATTAYWATRASSMSKTGP
jgi:hypothetical protein